MEAYTVVLQKTYTLRLAVEAGDVDEALDIAVSVSDEIPFSDWDEDSSAGIDTSW
jgi:hypothetical protein